MTLLKLTVWGFLILLIFVLFRQVWFKCFISKKKEKCKYRIHFFNCSSPQTDFAPMYLMYLISPLSYISKYLLSNYFIFWSSSCSFGVCSSLASSFHTNLLLAGPPVSLLTEPWRSWTRRRGEGRWWRWGRWSGVGSSATCWTPSGWLPLLGRKAGTASSYNECSRISN